VRRCCFLFTNIYNHHGHWNLVDQFAQRPRFLITLILVADQELDLCGPHVCMYTHACNTIAYGYTHSVSKIKCGFGIQTLSHKNMVLYLI
jgi:hypothetical protein